MKPLFIYNLKRIFGRGVQSLRSNEISDGEAIFRLTKIAQPQHT